MILPTALRKDFTFSVSCRSDAHHCHKALLGHVDTYLSKLRYPGAQEKELES